MDELTSDAIAGTFRIWQRRRGHRFSLDDVATAWEAARARPDATRVLDLGTGIGSVALMLAWKLREARLVAIEAQDESFALARRSIDDNGLADRVTLVHGDIRDGDVLSAATAEGPFELVSGTPPYAPPGTSTPSPDPQRAHARVELRGGVEVYVAAMARTLSDDGRGVVCADARRPERVIDAAHVEGLAIVARREVVPREGRPPLFTIWTLARHAPNGELAHPPLIVRDAAGERTEQAHEIRKFFDLPFRNEG